MIFLNSWITNQLLRFHILRMICYRWGAPICRSDCVSVCSTNSFQNRNRFHSFVFKLTKKKQQWHCLSKNTFAFSTEMVVYFRFPFAQTIATSHEIQKAGVNLWIWWETENDTQHRHHLFSFVAFCYFAFENTIQIQSRMKKTHKRDEEKRFIRALNLVCFTSGILWIRCFWCD